MSCGEGAKSSGEDGISCGDSCGNWGEAELTAANAASRLECWLPAAAGVMSTGRSPSGP